MSDALYLDTAWGQTFDAIQRSTSDVVPLATDLDLASLSQPWPNTAPLPTTASTQRHPATFLIIGEGFLFAEYTTDGGEHGIRMTKLVRH